MAFTISAESWLFQLAKGWLAIGYRLARISRSCGPWRRRLAIGYGGGGAIGEIWLS